MRVGFDASPICDASPCGVVCVNAQHNKLGGAATGTISRSTLRVKSITVAPANTHVTAHMFDCTSRSAKKVELSLIFITITVRTSPNQREPIRLLTDVFVDHREARDGLQHQLTCFHRSV